MAIPYIGIPDFYLMVFVMRLTTLFIISVAAVLVKGGVFLLLENTFQLASLSVNV